MIAPAPVHSVHPLASLQIVLRGRPRWSHSGSSSFVQESRHKTGCFSVMWRGRSGGAPGAQPLSFRSAQHAGLARRKQRARSGRSEACWRAEHASQPTRYVQTCQKLSQASRALNAPGNVDVVTLIQIWKTKNRALSSGIGTLIKE